MKSLKIIIINSFVFLMLMVSACSSEEKTDSPKTKAGKMLQAGTWSIDNVMADQLNVSDSFTGMQLRFYTDTYSSINGALLWPASGTWQFTSDEATAFERDGDIIIQIVEASDKSLILEFPWEGTLGTGRSVSGNYRFTFKR